ncbi:MAG: heme-binding protein, partial [Raoultella planticola]
MHTTPNAELDRRINAAISRQLAPPPASLTLTDAALLAHCAIDAANNANVPIVFSLVDAHGLQRYFFSQDNALLISHT